MSYTSDQQRPYKRMCRRGERMFLEQRAKIIKPHPGKNRHERRAVIASAKVIQERAWRNFIIGWHNVAKEIEVLRHMPEPNE